MSDHMAILSDLSFNNEIEQQPSAKKSKSPYWKFNVSYLEDHDFEPNFKLLWKEILGRKTYYENITEWWDKCFKKEFKRFAISFATESVSATKRYENYLHECLRQLGLALNTQADLKEYNDIKRKLSTVEEAKTKGLMMRGRPKNFIEDETFSGNHLIIEKRNQAAKTIEALLDPEGRKITQEDRKADLLRNHYNLVFTLQAKDDVLYKKFADTIKQEISANQQADLTLPFTEAEIWSVVNNMPKKKTPGTDGIPVEFYFFAWDLIKTSLIELFFFSKKKKQKNFY